MGQPAKRLIVALRGQDFLACVHYVVGTRCGGLVGVPLAFGDFFGNLGNFSLKVFFGIYDLVDLSITSISNSCQNGAK